MDSTLKPLVSSSLTDLLRAMQPPEWVERLKDEYARTGTYDPAELYRLLGDPNKRVEVQPQFTVSTLLAAVQAG